MSVALFVQKRNPSKYDTEQFTVFKNVKQSDEVKLCRYGWLQIHTQII